jgi:hypothetical protein
MCSGKLLALRLIKMSNVIFRSIDTPTREDLTWEESWTGEDEGLIYCWKKGIEMSFENPELAGRAAQGELVVLHWKGGAEKKLKKDSEDGTFNYLATWQGLRGQDLNLDLDKTLTLTCTKYNHKVIFKPQRLNKE